MPKVNTYDIKGKKVSEIELSDDIFAVEVSTSSMHQVIVAHLANKRQGTQSALTRAEVSGGGKKPWRQKGTGRARVGSSRNPVWKHGGVAFAPKPRDYSKSVNKKVRRLAIKSALTGKLADKQLYVLEDLNIEAPKTKEMVGVLKALKIDGKALIVTKDVNEDVVRASSNIKGVKTTISTSMNVYDILNCESLILTRTAVESIQEVFA
ncbi:MAG: 50S ribosomal protein L4 [Clostridia bacterium]|nr:50S ribosomal protein L4 [Clostridia bacterium]